MNKLIVVGLSLFLFAFNTKSQSNSVLSDGEWYKIAVNEAGVYKINRSFLSDIGIDVANLDPRKIQIYGNPGGMLPQQNNAERVLDLAETAIMVSGESDGSFDSDDFIIFYADGPDTYHYEDSQLIYEQNLYAEQNFYFITLGNTNGKRIGSTENEGNDFTRVTSFNDFSHHQLTITNLLTSGRKWYGEKFDITTEYIIEATAPGIKPNSDITISSKVMAQSFAESSFDLKLNGAAVGSQAVAGIPDYNISFYKYRIKGAEDVSLFTLNSDQITNPQQLNLTYSYNKNTSGRSVGYLDRVTIETIRNLKWYGETTLFRSLVSLDNPQTTFEISETDNDIKIWNITDKTNPLIQLHSQQSGKSTFGATTEALNEYALFKISTLPVPSFIEEIATQNLRAMSVPDLLIITHPDFVIEAQRLASFRSSNDQLLASVVTTDQIYHEFSSGRQDITAIRDFTKHLFDKGSRLKYLLLFGRGSYDYLNVIPNNTNYVPIYESRNSLDPLKTYGSDDYYGFLDDSEGEWEEIEDSDTHNLDIGVGRLPVTNLEEAKNVVDKLIRYSSDENNFGSWRNVILFVADDEDINLHHKQADELATIVDTTYDALNTSKLYLDAYQQISNPSGERSPEASEALNEAVDNGALIINYTGHGGESGWMQEQVLDQIMINEWDNEYRLPLFVTATCEFSRHDDPRRVSGGELVITNPNGGGIGIVSTCRPVESAFNFALNKAFYDAFFQSKNDPDLRLGDIIRLTKNETNKIGNRNFALLGDPSVRLSQPKQTIKIDKIESDGKAVDTLSATSKITISGEIMSELGVKNSSFNGTLYAVIYDKESLFTTIGNGNPPFNYYAQENVIFRGTASVIDGQYEFSFIVPKNISYQLDEGKISLYAVNDKSTTDAQGSQYIAVGGSKNQPSLDTEGPQIEIYLGDSTNRSFSDIASNTYLLAQLEDESGINISGYGIGNNLVAILDDSIEFILNEYYEAALDTYKRGWVNFPMTKLNKGEHQLTLKAWDTHNNSSQKSIEFTVLDPNKLSVSSLFNFPNPFQEETTFSFQHNRSGEDLEVILDIFSNSGHLIQKYEFTLEESRSNVNLVNWDGSNGLGEKLRAGLYLFKLTVRSNKDGTTGTRQAKLILIN